MISVDKKWLMRRRCGRVVLASYDVIVAIDHNRGAIIRFSLHQMRWASSKNSTTMRKRLYASCFCNGNGDTCLLA
ncbi:hypothetical protein M3J09_013513 [Ascochyta lentis]